MKIVGIIFATCLPMTITHNLNREGSVRKLEKRSDEFPPVTRQARAAIYLLARKIRARDGKKVVETMLQGARETSASANTKYFQKRGTFAMAVREFHSLKPQKTMEMEINPLADTFIIDGIVGDRLIQVKTRGHRGLPSVEIKQLGVKPNTPFYMNYIIYYVN